MPTTTETKVFPAETRCEKCNGQLAYRQDFSRGARTVACSVCRVPVRPDHPMQRKLDAEWDELERQQRANPPAPAAAPDYGGLHYGDGNEPLARLAAAVEALARRVAALEARKK